MAGPGQYALIQCNRSIQDSYGWIGAFYGGDGRPITANCTAGDACPRVVAAMNVLTAPATRWCALHNIQMIPNNPLVGLNFQQLHDFSGALGAAPMATKLSRRHRAGDTNDHRGRRALEHWRPPATRAAGCRGGRCFHHRHQPHGIGDASPALRQLPNGQRVWTVTRGSQAQRISRRHRSCGRTAKRDFA